MVPCTFGMDLHPLCIVRLTHDNNEFSREVENPIRRNRKVTNISTGISSRKCNISVYKLSIGSTAYASSLPNLATMPPHRAQVAIVGGGIAGLTLALIFERLHVSCVLFESRRVLLPMKGPASAFCQTVCES